MAAAVAKENNNETEKDKGFCYSISTTTHYPSNSQRILSSFTSTLTFLYFSFIYNIRPSPLFYYLLPVCLSSFTSTLALFFYSSSILFYYKKFQNIIIFFKIEIINLLMFML